MAGELVMRLVQEHGTTLVPVDSEHSALFQCLHGVDPSHVARLTVTGSGGPLWEKTAAEILAASREEVLAHPKWQMGPKITVDSATLMNKGLELIEARWLFGIEFSRLGVLIHPEAAVHAMVELVDGTVLAHMSVCDMRLPIQYALSFPDRWPSSLGRLEFPRLGRLRFYEPDLERFPCLRLSQDAAVQGGSVCVVLNGANDIAVQTYLDGGLAFGDIPRVIAQTIEQHTAVAHPSLDEILAIDSWARQVASSLVQEAPNSAQPHHRFRGAHRT